MTNSSSQQTSIKVFLIAFNDKGRVGKKIGCDHSIVPVLITIPFTQNPLRAAIERPLNISAELPEDFNIGQTNLDSKQSKRFH